MKKDIAIKVSFITLLVNIALALFKFIIGLISHSGAMISDAVHSASDVFSTIIVMVGVTVSHKNEDDEHQYGHEKLESVASIVLSIILASAGLGIGFEGVMLILGDKSEIQTPTSLALIGAVISILVKEWMYHYTKNAAKKIKSDALMADAWHHRSDALSSIGSFIGIFGAIQGFLILEPLASVVICGFILKAAFEIFVSATNKVVDKSLDSEMVKEIEKAIFSIEGVIAIDDLKTRISGNKYFVDVEISVNGEMSLTKAHSISHKVHDEVEKIEDIKHCMVHVNPYPH